MKPIEIEVIRSDGQKGFIPLNRIDDALKSKKFNLVNPEQELEVISPQGEAGYIKVTNIGAALKKDIS